MGWYASKDDQTLGRLIENWKHEALEVFYDIEGWRGFTEKRTNWPHPFRNFFVRTSCLCSLIRLHFPAIDPTPIEDIYEAISLWHSDKSAKRLPEQSVLQVIMDRAIMRLQSVEWAIHARMLDEKPTDRSRKRPGRPKGTTKTTLRLDERIWKARKSGTDIDEIARELDLTVDEVKRALDRNRKRVRKPKAT